MRIGKRVKTEFGRIESKANTPTIRNKLSIVVKGK